MGAKPGSYTERYGAVWRPLLVAAVLAALVCPAASAQAQSAQQLIEQGDWDAAGEEAMLRDDPASLRIRSRMAFWQGDDEAAMHFAQAAVEVGGARGEHLRSLAEIARLEWFYGERDQAIDGLRGLVREAPDSVEFRYELGWRLIDEGEVDEGRAILEGLARRYNDGLITEIDDLVWLGQAMKAAGRARDANRAFSRALADDEEHLEANLRFGQLMWSRYNTAEAEGAFKKVLERHENHPEALAGMAHIEFYRSGRFVESMELIDRAREHYPGHPEVLRARAELLIAQGAWERGDEQAAQLLERAPLDGQGLALAAAAAFLRGDGDRFEKLQARFDERRANRPDLLTTVGEFASFNNRHRRSVAFFEEALERDDEHAPALRGLGMSLTRTGEEVRGIEVMERAFDADRFQVPVYNTLELYDRGLRDYVTDDVEGFRLRAHMSQFELIRDIMEPFVAEARADMEARYGVELPSLTIEVFADPQSFSVRTVGLPHIDPHGICFGRVVLTRSPGDGNFNWPMVVWHELAHSYHLELSNERVPRWFTEGLAEYETRLHNPSWTRFHDIDLARRLAHGQLWSIAEMDRAFMTGRGLEVSQAYQAAMLIMVYLDEEYGFDAIVDMLERFADEPEVEKVFEAALGKPVEQVDREFEQWLRRQYAGLLHQELVDSARVGRMMADEDISHGSPAEGAVYRAMVAAMKGDEQRARMNLDNAKRRGGDEAAVAVMIPMVYRVLDDLDAGMEAGREALDAGVESIDLRRTMSEMARQLGRDEEAYVHAVAAVGLAPMDPASWALLMVSAERADEPWAVQRGMVELYEREPHDPRLVRQLTSFLVDRGDYDEALRAAQRWTEIAALDATAQQTLGRAAARAGDVDTATTAWHRAALASPARREGIFQEAVDELEDAGHLEAAQQFRRRLQSEED